jgi:ER degradation enhancer, mannosidase alpha-like 2
MTQALLARMTAAPLIAILIFTTLPANQTLAATETTNASAYEDVATPADDTLPSQAEMAERVKAEFLHAWDGYRQYAWGHDELRPLSKQPFDWYGTSLLMTPVDALDTMILMGLTKQADETRHLIDTQLSFDKDIYVKNFEITIRLVGGLLSSYELTGDKRLLELADDLAQRLMPVFNSPTGMPYVEVNLKTGAVRGEDTNPAEVGTMLLEFGTLSKLTHKPEYYAKAKRAVVALYNRRSAIGLFGSGINIRTGAWTGFTSNVGGGSDSYYEYLLKAWKLFGDKDCEQMWETSVAAINKYDADDASTGFWYGEADMNTGARTGTHFGALAAFFPGTLALSGDLNRAARLEDSCYKMWTTFGIEPEVINYDTMKILSPGYELRPEIIESAYYLYYYTRDPKYQRMGMTYFDSIVKYCRTPVAFTALSNVETKTQRDDMESYFFAETLKYLYLLLGNPDRIDLTKTVLNTEAHPLNRIS